MAESRIDFPSEDSLVCPITQEIMKQPVIAGDGFTYELDAITKWKDQHHRMNEQGKMVFQSPMTNLWAEWKDPVLNKTKLLLINDVNKKDPSRAFYCPITGKLMEDPVIAADGFTYEKSALVARFKSGNLISPVTHKLLSSEEFKPNTSLKSDISAYKDQLKGDAKESKVELKAPPSKKLIDPKIAAMTFHKGIHPRLMQAIIPDRKLASDVESTHVRNQRGAIKLKLTPEDERDFKKQEAKYNVATQALRQELKENYHNEYKTSVNTIRIVPEIVELYMKTKGIPWGPSTIVGKGGLKGVVQGVDWQLPVLPFNQAKELVLTFAKSFAEPNLKLFDGSDQSAFVMSTKSTPAPAGEISDDNIWEPKDQDEAKLYAHVQKFLRIQKSQSDQASGEKYRIIFNANAFLKNALPEHISKNPKLEPYIRGALAPRLMLFFDTQLADKKCDMQSVEPDFYISPQKVTDTHVHLEVGGYNPKQSISSQHLIICQDVSGSMNELIQAVLAEYLNPEQQLILWARQEFMIYYTNDPNLFQLYNSNRNACLQFLEKNAQNGDAYWVKLRDAVKTSIEREKTFGDILEEKEVKEMIKKHNGELPTRIHFSKVALGQLVDEFKNRSDVRISLIPYSSYATPAIVRAKPDELKSAISSLKAGGGTNYLPVFDQVVSLCRNGQSEDVFVTFSSDGQPSDLKLETVNKANQKLSELKDKQPVQVNTLGFKLDEIENPTTRENARRILTELTSSGKTKGLVQFCEDHSRLFNTVSYLANLPESKETSTWYLYHKDGDSLYRIPVPDRSSVREAIAIPLAKCPGIPDDPNKVIVNIEGFEPIIVDKKMAVIPVKSIDDSPDVTSLKATLAGLNIDITDEKSFRDDKNLTVLRALINANAEMKKTDSVEFLNKVLQGKFVHLYDPTIPHPDVTQMKSILVDMKVDISDTKSISENKVTIDMLIDVAKKLNQTEVNQFLQDVSKGKYVRMPDPPAEIFPDPDESLESATTRSASKYVRRRHRGGARSAPQPSEDDDNDDDTPKPTEANVGKKYDTAEYDKLTEWQKGIDTLIELRALLSKEAIPVKAHDLKEEKKVVPSSGTVKFFAAATDSASPKREESEDEKQRSQRAPGKRAGDNTG